MRYRQLGNSGLRVSELSFGTMTFGNVGYRGPVIGSTDVKEGRRQARHVPGCRRQPRRYGRRLADGASEEIVGEVLQGRRDKVLAATKSGSPPAAILMMVASPVITWCAPVRAVSGGCR